MINVSGRFRQRLYNDERNYLEEVKLRLKNSTTLTMKNKWIWNGGLSFDDAVTSDSDLEVGAAIINKHEVMLNNIYGTFDSYDFDGATVTTRIGLVVDETTDPPTEEWITKGMYIVDTADYNDTYIKLSCLDYMSKFDKKFPSTIAFGSGITAGYIISSICTYCGVTLGNASFPNYNLELETGPTTDCTCRDVISWIAQVCGCFARCGPDGKLYLKWFDRDGLEDVMDGIDGGIFDNGSQSVYVTGDDVDGGSFNPWNTGDVADGGDFDDWANGIHYISSTFSHSVSVDDVVITGVRILVKTGAETSNDIVTHFVGSTGYVIEISNNPLITEDNVDDVLDILDVRLIGLTFRKANLTTPSDPSIEAGDVGIYWDRKGNHYPILISRVTFCPGESQAIVSAAQTPVRNSSERYSAETKAYLEMKEAVFVEKSARELAVEALQNAVRNANGLYFTDIEDQTTHAHTYYLHNKGGENGLAQSDIRIMFSDVGITVTNNGTAAHPTWYGLTVDGNLISNILSTVGVNADWIRSGSISLGGTGTGNVNGAINIYNSSGTLIGKWDKNGVVINSGSMNINNGTFSVNPNGDVVANSINIGPFTAVNLSEEDEFGAIWHYKAFSGGDKEAYNDISENINKTGIYFNENSNFQLGYKQSNSSQLVQMVFGDERVSQSKTSAVRLVYGDTSGNGYNDLRLCDTDFALRVYRKQYSDAPFEVGWNGNLYVAGNLSVGGTKPRLVTTEDYGKRYLYCYETPTPMFGDIGEGVIGEDGLCYIQIDPTFSETISGETTYQVFLQNYGEGTAYIKERKGSYFVVKGTPGMEFGWELKAKQRDYEMLRLDRKVEEANTETEDYGELALSHITEIMNERGHAA